MNKMTSFLYLALLLPSLSLALESMDDNELGRTTGEGIGVIVENLSIDGKTEGFDITLDGLAKTQPLKDLIFIEHAPMTVVNNRLVSQVCTVGNNKIHGLLGSEVVWIII